MPARRTLIQVLVAVGVLGWVGWEALREPVQLAHVEKAAHAPMTESFSEEGKTRLKARYALAAPVAGQLRRVTLQPGDAVQAGQVVAWIDPTSPGLLDGRSHRRAEAELAAARSQHRAARQRVQAAQAASGLARSSLQRAIRLHEGRVMSQEALEQAQAQAARTAAELSAAQAEAQAARQRVEEARAALWQEEPGPAAGQDSAAAADAAPRAAGRQPVAVVAPVTGVVLKRTLESATPVTVGQALMEIGDTAQLEIEAEVLSADAVQLRPGTPVRLLHWGGAGTLQAHVRRVEPGGFTKVSALGVEEQRTRVILDFDSPRSEWAALGDAYRVELEFLLRHEDRALQVPASSLFLDDRGKPGNYALYRVVDGRARLTSVRTGLRSATHVQVLEGLAEGDAVIVQPDERIVDGTRIEAH